MRLIIVRHAIAEDREIFAETGRPDTERPLTLRGKKRMRLVARGLRRVLPQVDRIVSSPLLRAVETAEIVQKAYKLGEFQRTKTLAPECPVETFAEWLARQRKLQSLLVVGHEPHLSRVASFLLARRKRSFVLFKKGAVCVLDFSDAPTPGSAQLHALLQPSTLRLLGK